jgi:L-rhamnose-H+ transport protein
MPNPVLGVILHAIGGFAAGSFYIPFKRVQKWAWESYWLVGGFFAWIVAPWVVALIVCPDLGEILTRAPRESLFSAFGFGVLWGIGGLTSGLSMRYLGMSLGYALALGFCAAFGTIIPPIFNHEFGDLASKLSGQTVLLGVAVCLAGIAICGKAGVRKEGELTADQKQATISEFNFSKGLWIAIFSGVMSACWAYGLAAGEPIAELAKEGGTGDLWVNSPVLVVVAAGGFLTNFVWCIFLNRRNRTAINYTRGDGISLASNYLFSALAGITWYCQFMFYGMGSTKMGAYKFSSWTIHMAFIIVFSNMWALLLHEWKGTSRKTHNVVFAGIIVLILSTIVVGYGNYLGALSK